MSDEVRKKKDLFASISHFQLTPSKPPRGEASCGSKGQGARGKRIPTARAILLLLAPSPQPLKRGDGGGLSPLREI